MTYPWFHTWLNLVMFCTKGCLWCSKVLKGRKVQIRPHQCTDSFLVQWVGRLYHITAYAVGQACLYRKTGWTEFQIFCQIKQYTYVSTVCQVFAFKSKHVYMYECVIQISCSLCTRTCYCVSKLFITLSHGNEPLKHFVFCNIPWADFSRRNI